MIRAAVVLVIAGVAGLMAYLAFVGECPGGAVVRTEEQCAASGGLPRELCRTVFSRAAEVARSAGTVYTDRDQCYREFGACLAHATLVGGYVPQPAGFCVKANGSALASMVPIYRGAAAR
jgi:uncharacterized protein YgiB involved in biofilm formation